MSKMEFKGIASTTHTDLHGERVTKEFLDQQVKQFYEMKQPLWGYWNHQTTLPPKTIIYDQEVEKRDDGEYQLVVKGSLFRTKDFSYIDQTDITIPEVNKDDVRDTIESLDEYDFGLSNIIYDPRNFDQKYVKPIISSIDKLIPTEEKLYIRKSVIHQAVVFLSSAFIVGFVSRLGEKTADKVVEYVTNILNNSNLKERPDVILHVPTKQQDILVEGAIEEADGKTINKALKKTPQLISFSEKLISQNRTGHFSQIKFLFNPKNDEWEINYILTRVSQRVILGPRYKNKSHPLFKRWNSERERFDRKDQTEMGMSLGFIQDD